MKKQKVNFSYRKQTILNTELRQIISTFYSGIYIKALLCYLCCYRKSKLFSRCWLKTFKLLCLTFQFKFSGALIVYTSNDCVWPAVTNGETQYVHCLSCSYSANIKLHLIVTGILVLWWTTFWALQLLIDKNLCTLTIC